MNRYRIVHTTVYHYHEPVAVSNNHIHLVPRNLPHQRLLEHVLETKPEAVAVNSYLDWFGNTAGTFAIERPHRELIVTSRSLVEREAPFHVDPAATWPWEALARAIAGNDPQLHRIAEFTWPSHLVPAARELSEFAAVSAAPGRPVLDLALDLSNRIYRGFTYDAKATAVNTPVVEVLRLRRGVCQDFALVLIGALRALGLPARYVSGYLETVPLPGQVRLVGADASHAWVQVHTGDPNLGVDGWVDLDPTNGCIAGARHITVAWGRDFSDVSPLKGMILGGGQAQVSVSVDVAPQGPTSGPPHSQSQSQG